MRKLMAVIVALAAFAGAGQVLAQQAGEAVEGIKPAAVTGGVPAAEAVPDHSTDLYQAKSVSERGGDRSYTASEPLAGALDPPPTEPSTATLQSPDQ